MQLLTIIIYSFCSSQDELEPWSYKKPLSQAKNKVGTVSCWNKKNQRFSQQNYDTNPGRNSTNARCSKTWFKRRFFCLKWTIYNGRRKICINFQTDTDRLKIVVYRYRNNTCLKDTEMDLKLTEYKSFLLNAFTSWATLIFSTSTALYCMKQLFIIRKNSLTNGCSLSNQRFPIVLGIKNAIWTR